MSTNTNDIELARLNARMDTHPAPPLVVDNVSGLPAWELEGGAVENSPAGHPA